MWRLKCVTFGSRTFAVSLLAVENRLPLGALVRPYLSVKVGDLSDPS